MTLEFILFQALEVVTLVATKGLLLKSLTNNLPKAIKVLQLVAMQNSTIRMEQRPKIGEKVRMNL